MNNQTTHQFSPLPFHPAYRCYIRTIFRYSSNSSLSSTATTSLNLLAFRLMLFLFASNTCQRPSDSAGPTTTISCPLSSGLLSMPCATTTSSLRNS